MTMNNATATLDQPTIKPKTIKRKIDKSTVNGAIVGKRVKTKSVSKWDDWFEPPPIPPEERFFSAFLEEPKLAQEMYGGEVYEYYPLGKYIVAAPGVCGGRPTFKYTRLEVSMILALLARGDTIEDILDNYSSSSINKEAILEAIRLGREAFLHSTRSVRTSMPRIELIPS